ncbi:MAG: fibrobacter succinogenes major paralogous domain-containing protein [Fibrobacter sp.]|nr:fibrobacter succinogenes major paralogous domain-containing protein [Fibrobacter sp.]
MSLKKLQILVASALTVAAFMACNNASSSPEGLNDDLSVVENSGGVNASTLQSQNAVADVPDASETTAVPVENQIEAQSANDSASLDSIMDILFPNGIDGIDTARHDPDSVGVWHFYDSKESHMNPAFAYGEMTDPRDGKVYKTTQIGGKTWMAENLNYFDIEGAASSIKNDWCYWDKPENCESAGRLYTWKVAKRVCPEGWRLPTKADWESLLQEVGADSLNEILWKGSSKLKSVNGWENGGSGTDDFGFTAVPAGMKFTTRTQDGFTYHGCSSLMWAATEADGGAADSLAYHMYLDCSNDNAIVNTVRKINGLSVRCVKD